MNKISKEKNSGNQANPFNQGSVTNNQNWNLRKLGDIVEIINGRNQSAVVSNDGNYPIYGSAGNLMGFAKEYLCEKGTTIIGRKGNIANPIYINERFWNVDTAFGLYPKNGYLTKFIYYLCQTIDFKSRNRGTTIPSLVKSDLQNIDVPFTTSLSEQQRIVSILDEAFASIAKAKANAEKNLKNARELFESYLEGVFARKGDGWEKKNLGDVVEFKGGGTPSTKNKSYWNGHIPWVSPKDMKSREISKSEDLITDIAVKESTTSIIPVNSTLIVVRSGILSRIVPLGLTVREVTINQDLKALIPSKKINSEFLFYLMEGNMKYLLSKVTRGATVHRLMTDSIRELEISLPSLKEQQTIVRQIDALQAETQKLEAVYQKKIADLEELKKSILLKAFTGELKSKNN